METSANQTPPSEGGFLRRLSLSLGDSFESTVFFSDLAEFSGIARGGSIRNSCRSHRSHRRTPSYRRPNLAPFKDDEDTARLLHRRESVPSNVNSRIPELPQNLAIPRKPDPSHVQDGRPGEEASINSTSDQLSTTSNLDKVYLRSWRLAFTLAG
jgi:hypothetical protein